MMALNKTNTQRNSMWSYPTDVKSTYRRATLRKWGLIVTWMFILVAPSTVKDDDDGTDASDPKSLPLPLLHHAAGIRSGLSTL